MSGFREHRGGGGRNTAMKLHRAAVESLWVGLLLLGAIGCGGQRHGSSGDADSKAGGATSLSDAAAIEAAPVALKLVIVGDGLETESGDAALGEAIARLWSTEVGGELEIRHLACGPGQALSKEDVETALAGDAVIYPVGLLGELAERNGLLEIPAEVLRDRTFGRRDIFDFPSEQEATWGKTIYAFPLGSPQFALYYRADVFERLGLSPPKTWREYQQAAEKMASESPSLTTVEPLGPGWASQVLLARAAPYARHRSQYSTLFNYSTMAPLVNGPPFVQALEELAATAKLRASKDATMLRITPHEARAQFWRGGVGMTLSWPTRAAAIESPPALGEDGENESSPQTPPEAQPQAPPQAQFEVAFAELPGASLAYNSRSERWEQKPTDEAQTTSLLGIAGRAASVTRRSKHSEAAFRLLARVSGADWSGQLAPLCRDTTLYRAAHVTTAAQWVEQDASLAAAKQYAELSQKLQSGSAWLSSPALPGRAEYLAALDEAVWSVVERGESAQAALDAAAIKWQEITERLGVESQRKAYERSLGLEP